MGNKKRILITNARAFISLDLARLFHAQDVEVFTADSDRFHICSLSKAVKKKFLVPSPRFFQKEYVDAIFDIIKENQIDLVIPIYEEVFYLARELDRFPKGCSLFSSSFEILENLHNKWLFQEKVKNLGFSIPKTYLLRNEEDLKNIPLDYPFILKRCYSRASQKIIKVNTIRDIPDKDITTEGPWVAQEWLEGEKYCTYSICRKGVIQAHVTYPVEFSINNNSCLSFKEVEHAKIFEWVKRFVFCEHYSGQIGLDFIETEDGQVFAIECNPRATSGLHLLSSEKKLVDIFLGKDFATLLRPAKKVVKKIGFAMIFYGWKSSSFLNFLKSFFKFKDIIFSTKDILPFLFQPFLFVYYLFKSRKLRKKFPSMFTHDIDWNGTVESLKNLEV